MTVSTTSSKQAAQTGDGSNKTFQYSFRILSASDLEVRIRTTSTGAETAPLTLNTDYTVTNVGQAGGGNVVLTASYTAPTSGQQVFIKRVVALTQTTDYVPNDPFPAAAHEDALDKLTFIAQQQQEVFDRAVVFPETDTASTAIPDSVTRANKFLGFGASGEITTLSSTGAAPSSVDTGNIVDDAVTQAKIANDAVGTDQLAADAVTQAKIADDAVGQAQIADDAVGSAQIADNAVALGTQTTGNYVSAISGGNAITTSGGGSEDATVTVNHADTSSQASVNNSGNTVIQDVTLDTYGHVTGLTSTTISTTSLPVSYHAIGDYVIGVNLSNNNVAGGSTVAGNFLNTILLTTSDGTPSGSFEAAELKTSGTVGSGTWRNNAKGGTSAAQVGGIWVRTA